MSAIAATATCAVDHDHDRDYPALLSAVRGGFKGGALHASGGQPLFRTDAADLWVAYLDGLPADRQVHNCNACRRFINAYGGLVTIAEDGTTESALWHLESVPRFYTDAIQAMRWIVKRAWVSGPFLSSDATLGTPQTGAWTHFAVTNARPFVGAVRNAAQAMAAKCEDFTTVSRALSEFTPDMLAQAMRLLEAETLARSEKFIGPVKWLQDLHAARADVHNRHTLNNLLWRAIVLAPEGYCHPRASVIGPLLEDIAAAMSFATIKRRFDAKLHPLRYQRPQAAPDAGNIDQAERIVERLGVARSLERRYARLDEIETIWRPGPVNSPKRSLGGVFANLRAAGEPGNVAPVNIPEQTITWEKFERTVLPGALAIDYYVRPGPGPFIAFTTATHADAPPILKWDREDKRNPVAWYLYVNGSLPEQWRLTTWSWSAVAAVARLPTMWGDNPSPHLGDGVVLILDGAADTRTNQGLALFPESLRGELHEIRATIEAYSRGGELTGRDQASACGVDVRHNPNAKDVGVRVRTAGGWAAYRIDRWD